MTQKSANRKSATKTRNSRSAPGIILAVLGGLLVILAGGWIALSGRDNLPPNYVPEVTGGPALKVDQQTIDFGDVKFNEIVTASFELTNVGDKPLRFLEDPYIELVEGC